VHLHIFFSRFSPRVPLLDVQLGNLASAKGSSKVLSPSLKAITRKSALAEGYVPDDTPTEKQKQVELALEDVWTNVVLGRQVL
jgi:hypothetical protein